MRNKRHWYAISFLYGESSSHTYSSGCVSLMKKDKLSINTLKAIKSACNVPENAVIIAVSYLGHMTEKEFNGIDN